MQNNIVAWPNTTKVKIGLSSCQEQATLQVSADHPKKTKTVLNVQKQDVSTQTTMQEVAAQTPAVRKEVCQAHNKQRDDSA